MTIEESLLILSGSFMGSLAHCVGMCGGIVLGLNMKERQDSKFMQVWGNLLYFLGRLCGYVSVGIAFSIVSVNLGFSSFASGIIFIVLGILLLISAIIFTFFPKGFGVFSDTRSNQADTGNVLLHHSGSLSSHLFIQPISRILSKIGAFCNVSYKKIFSIAFQSDNIIKFFVIGILNGLLPCGLVYMFAIKAANMMSISGAIIVMLIFGLGTFLPLFLVGIFSVRVLNSKLRKFFLWLCFVIMAYFGTHSIYNGYMQITANQAHNPHTHYHH